MKTGFVAPRTPVKEVLAGLGAQVLGLNRVGIHDNSFELGGDSMLATQFLSRVRGAMQVEFPLHSVFEAPTVVALARSIEMASGVVQGTPCPPLQPISRDGDLLLSFAQQRLWFLDQLAPRRPIYSIPSAMCLNGRLHVAALEQTLREIVRRHEALRTTFASVGGRPVQIVSPALSTAPYKNVSNFRRLLVPHPP